MVVTTIGVAVLSVAVMRVLELWWMARDRQDRAWREGDEIPDAVE